MKIKGEAIRVLRESQGLSVSDLARICGVRRQAVEAWEKGDVRKFDTLTKIAAALNVSGKYLLED
jgi:transcriptional regulator with XRE-family HTH domain